MKFDRRAFLAGSSASAVLSRRVAAQVGTNLTPEHFGAKGDGETNDTRAFEALSDEVNRRGGGTISLHSGRTYVVGAQMRVGPYGWNPASILDLHDLSAPLTIIGNGATLRSQSGLKFGALDPETGAPSNRPLPNVRVTELASPYVAMIYVHECGARVEIRDVELDGNIRQLRIGGKWGDSGWQVPAAGILLAHNRGPEIVENVQSYHGTDGKRLARL